MFATLVLGLPSQSGGGELVVKHGDREVRLDLRCDEPGEIAFAAFYADCLHEVLPVTAGCRVTLVFNLVRKGKGAAPEPPGYEAQTTQVVALLSAWANARPNIEPDDIDGAEDIDSIPEKLVYPLGHAYTPAELAFDKLCDLHLALLTVWEAGTAEENFDYRRSYRRSRYGDRDDDEDGGDGGDDQDDFEVVEVLDCDRSLAEWRRPDGASVTLGKLPIEDGEVAPPDALDGMTPDEQHFHEATGNAGASFERTYARAALVLWPSARILAVLNQAGPATTLPYLDEMTAKWNAADGIVTSPVRAQALELAGHMLVTWPDYAWHGRNQGDPSNAGWMFRLLVRLGDRDLVAVMIRRLVARRGHDQADSGAILEAVELFPKDQAAELLRAIVAAHAIEAPGACGALLGGALQGAFAHEPTRLIPAAQALADALPGDPALAPKDQWGRPRGSPVDAAFVADIVAVVDRVDAALAERTAAHLLAWPRHFDLDAVLVPASKKLLDGNGVRAGGPASSALHVASVAHLATRIAEPLEPPKDWTRPGRIGCRCTHCAELARFLADPAKESWTLRAAERFRRHVEENIRRAQVDVDTRTERRGSPHSLICRKNQASYQRRVAQRKQDIADMAVLGT